MKKLNLTKEQLKTLAQALLQPAPPPNPKLLAAMQKAKQLFTNK